MTAFPHVASTTASTRAVPWAVDVLGVAGLLFTAALIRIPLPFTPVPVTLQTLVILVVPFLLGRERATAGIMLYLLLGMAGQSAGFSLLAVGSTATYGYLAGFLLAPWILIAFPRTAVGIAGAMLTASVVILTLGSLWLCFLLGCSFSHALILGFLPFVAGDLAKLVIAYKGVQGTLLRRC